MSTTKIDRIRGRIVAALVAQHGPTAGDHIVSLVIELREAGDSTSQNALAKALAEQAAVTPAATRQYVFAADDILASPHAASVTPELVKAARQAAQMGVSKTVRAAAISARTPQGAAGALERAITDKRKADKARRAAPESDVIRLTERIGKLVAGSQLAPEDAATLASYLRKLADHVTATTAK